MFQRYFTALLFAVSVCALGQAAQAAPVELSLDDSIALALQAGSPSGIRVDLFLN
jgi:hypothetical protein